MKRVGRVFLHGRFLSFDFIFCFFLQNRPNRWSSARSPGGLEQKIIRQRNRINHLHALSTKAKVAELGLAFGKAAKSPKPLRFFPALLGCPGISRADSW